MTNFGRKTDRGWEFSDQLSYRVVGYDKDSLEKVQDDYAGAFKAPQPGTPHPTGLGLMPGSGTQDTSGVQGKGLVIKVAATHAGLITRNNGYYLPDKMRSAIPTWTEHYNKPIQVHHEDHKDPVGRVIGARYVETIGAVADRFKNSVLRDSYGKQVGLADIDFWRDFCSDGPFIRKLDQIKLMDSILSDPHYPGVGYIELTADITDPDAIQKVLDGRFLTGSVGAVSDKAVCSVCSTNWLEEDHCGHRPGKIYDGKKCFVVAGNLEYDEWSFVNTPADRHASIQFIQNSVVKDSAVEDSASRILYFIPNNLTDSVKEEPVMTVENAETSAELETPIEDSVKTEEEMVEASVDQTVIADSVEVKDADLVEIHPAEMIIERLFTDDGAGFSDEDEESLYEMMMAELNQDGDPSLEDAKLSTSARKKLASSTFCGPARSFPVNDCAHYTAAKRLLGRYKGPGDKSRILACIERKGKAMGCSGAKKDAKACAPCVEVGMEDATMTVEKHELSIEFKHEYEGELNDEMKVKVAEELLAMLSDKIGADTVLAVLADKSPVKKDELETQVAETIRLEDELGDKNEQLAALRKELQAVYADLSTLQDELISKNEMLRERTSSYIASIARLEGTFSDEFNSELATFSDEVLTNTLENSLRRVDIHQIADRLNDGLTRIPEETVDNPAAVPEPSTAIKDNENTNSEVVVAKPIFATQKVVDKIYHHIFVNDKNPQKAKEYYRDMVKQGFAAEDLSKMPVENTKEE